MSEDRTPFRLLRTPLRADRVCDAFEVPPLNELGLLAQLVEQVTLNHRVGGSSPSQPTPSYVDFERIFRGLLDTRKPN